jgi:hypothetical protein
MLAPALRLTAMRQAYLVLADPLAARRFARRALHGSSGGLPMYHSSRPSSKPNCLALRIAEEKLENSSTLESLTSPSASMARHVQSSGPLNLDRWNSQHAMPRKQHASCQKPVVPNQKKMSRRTSTL